MPLSEDLDIFLDVDEFASIAIIAGKQYKCILDTDPSVPGIGVQGKMIVACFKDSDVVGLHHGAAIAVDGKSYKVIGIQPSTTEQFTDVELKEV